MKKILVTACGGCTGLDVARSLKHSNLDIYVVGMDASEKGRYFGASLCDTVVAGPLANSNDYKDRIDEICYKQQIDAIIFNHSTELLQIGERALKFTSPCLLPEPKVIQTCADKWKTVQVLNDDEITPQSIKITTDDSISKAFGKIGSPLWLRLSRGSAGKGAILVKEPEHVKNWITYWRDIKGQPDGEWLLQEYLPGRNLNWSSIWYGGELVASGIMERLGYYQGSIAISGISGQTGVGEVVHSDAINDLCIRAVQKLSTRCHGVFAVDVQEDKYGDFKITEIENRLTAKPWLHAAAGLNFPEIIVRCLLKLPLDPAKRLNGSIEGTLLYRQLDIEPVIIHPFNDNQ